MTDVIAARFHPLYEERLHLLEGVPAPGAADTPETLDRRRAFEAPFGHPELPVVDTEERAIPGPNGPVRVRIYRAIERPATPPPTTIVLGRVLTTSGSSGVDNLVLAIPALTRPIAFAVAPSWSLVWAQEACSRTLTWV